MRIFLSNQSGHGAQVLDHQLVAGPHAAAGGAPKSTLVISDRGHPLRSPPGSGEVKGVGVVVHTVKPNNHGPRIARRVPFQKPKFSAIEAYDVAGLNPGTLKAQRG